MATQIFLNLSVKDLDIEDLDGHHWELVWMKG